MASQSSQLIGVLVGGGIGVFGSFGATYLIHLIQNRRRANSVKAIVISEIVAVKERAERYLQSESESRLKELRSSTPLLKSIAAEMGFLTITQAEAYRRVVSLSMEMSVEGNEEKVIFAIEACKEALVLFKAYKKQNTAIEGS